MKKLKLKSRHQLSKSQNKEMINRIRSISEKIGDALSKKRLELATVDEFELLLVDGKPMFLITDGIPFFTVRGALELKPTQKLVTVDAGAIPFVIKGADVMKPGIISVDPDIKEGDNVIVVEENHGKALAIGRALVDADQLMGDGGKGIKTLHMVGDKLWDVQL